MAEMEKKTVNAMGDVCPVPLVKAKNAIAELAGSGKVEVLVDNEIAVQNLEKMAQQKGYGFLVKEKKEKEYHVEFTVSETEPAETEEKTVCLVPAAKKTKLVVLSADHMGEGAEELGKILMKSFPTTDDDLVGLVQQVVDNANLVRYLGTTHNVPDRSQETDRRRCWIRAAVQR